ncbi:hypothetical protein LTR09_012826 [Extremus antarcticus]|uniref:Uncharacterized protein n=1 Tax=Extremus antarcticus TaxID=702011 RepID=A0AAJ0D4A0_9PEZI|nr:hypothetical protein LTR09_012826 [Extremus antarcticus]
MKPNVLPFIREKWNGVPEPTQSFDSKIVLITGANVGLGFKAAAKFAVHGAHQVILGVRNVSKGNTAKKQIDALITQFTTGKHCKIDVWELDMNSFNSIQLFAQRAKKELPRLDVVVLNAGVSPKDYIVESEGWESILQVNVLGTALLGLLLLPKLKASSAENDLSHLVVVTSEAHRWLEDKDFPDTKPYDGNLLAAINARPENGKAWDGMLQNARSKLFAMYITQALADLAAKKGGVPDTIVTSVCPGACKSDLTRSFKDAGIGYTVGLKLFDLLFNKTTEQGARVYVNTASVGQEGHGAWWKTTALTTPGDFVTSEKGRKMQKQVWGEILQALKAEVSKTEDLMEGAVWPV